MILFLVIILLFTVVYFTYYVIQSNCNLSNLPEQIIVDSNNNGKVILENEEIIEKADIDKNKLINSDEITFVPSDYDYEKSMFHVDYQDVCDSFQLISKFRPADNFDFIISSNIDMNWVSYLINNFVDLVNSSLQDARNNGDSYKIIGDKDPWKRFMKSIGKPVLHTDPSAFTQINIVELSKVVQYTNENLTIVDCTFLLKKNKVKDIMDVTVQFYDRNGSVEITNIVINGYLIKIYKDTTNHIYKQNQNLSNIYDVTDFDKKNEMILDSFQDLLVSKYKTHSSFKNYVSNIS